jgi:SAM-dependent MidA family methyltransferase
MCAPGAKEGVQAHGAISQAQLLHSLGITTRLEALMKKAKTKKEAQSLYAGYERLVGTGQKTDANGRTLHGMGEIYKAFAITSKDVGVPPAFEPVVSPPDESGTSSETERESSSH